MFWRTLEISLINCEINLILTSSANCVIIDATVENSCNNWGQVSKEQLTGININQK